MRCWSPISEAIRQARCLNLSWSRCVRCARAASSPVTAARLAVTAVGAESPATLLIPRGGDSIACNDTRYCWRMLPAQVPAWRQLYLKGNINEAHVHTRACTGSRFPVGRGSAVHYHHKEENKSEEMRTKSMWGLVYTRGYSKWCV